MVGRTDGELASPDPLGGGGGSFFPGISVSPAITGVARKRARSKVAHVSLMI